LGLYGKLTASERVGLKGKVGVVQKGDGLLHAGDEGNRQVHSYHLGSDIPSLEGLHIDVMDNTPLVR
jgi:hypothetical protein